jgi:hypothetical protein
MTTNSAAVDQLAPRVPAVTRLGQATAVEQSRAVAEVQAAIVVAQQCPRNVPLAIDMMRESCRRKELAERAFFSYKRGGGVVGGPSVHLARELARCWGNIQYGLREMRRDDEASEMLAYAWDVQTNSRCDNIVINPHRGYTGGRELTELRDVYENNANVGARRVREAIFAVLPAWYVEEAIALCNDTLKRGDGKPLPVRIAAAIEVFGNLGVTLGQLESRFGASKDWDERAVAQLLIAHRSITRGEITRDEAFPAAGGVTAADILGSAPSPAETPSNEGARQEPAHRGQAGKPALDKLTALFDTLQLDEAEQETVIAWLAGGEWTASAAQIKNVAGPLDDFLKHAEGNIPAAREAMWAAYRKVNGDAGE